MRILLVPKQLERLEHCHGSWKFLGTIFGGNFARKYHRSIMYESRVLEAMKNDEPIVALESTIITHGMPYPHNFKTAVRVEEIIRKHGVTPATTTILKGKIHVGLNESQIHELSMTDSSGTRVKCSRRDLATVVSQRLTAGTTVCGTMLLANLANISVMATGGIGGVHRNAERTFDVSADLIELSQTPIVVVCAGIKAILDIPKTLEYLETHGVPVITLGGTGKFPAFYCSDTHENIRSPITLSTVREVVDAVDIHKRLNLSTGMLVAVPIPRESSLNPQEVEMAIQEALKEAEDRNITGKGVTPFLLEKVNDLTSGRSLKANMALMENNAEKAAEIALLLKKKDSTPGVPSIFEGTKKPVVIGGAVFDTYLQVGETQIQMDETYYGKIRQSCGGVARNIAQALISLGVEDTKFLSAVGNDFPGKEILRSLGKQNLLVEVLTNQSTAKFAVLVDRNGEYRLGVGDLEIFSAIDSKFIRKHEGTLRSASLFVLDGNLSLEAISTIIDISSQHQIPIWYEPTDWDKGTKIFQSGNDKWHETLHFISPNRIELLGIAKYFGLVPSTATSMHPDDLQRVSEDLVRSYVPVVVTTLGSEGVRVSRKGGQSDPFYDKQGRLLEKDVIESRVYPPLVKDLESRISVSGCGDCLAAGIISGVLRGLSEEECVALSLEAAACSLRSIDPVPQNLVSIRQSVCRK